MMMIDEDDVALPMMMLLALLVVQCQEFDVT